MSARSNKQAEQRAQITKLLKGCALLSKVTKSTRETLINAAHLDWADAGDMIVDQGAPAKALYILGSGHVRLERDLDDERVMPLSYRAKGEVVTDAPLAKESRHNARVVAMTACDLVRIDTSTLQSWMTKDNTLMLGVLGSLAQRQRQAEDRVGSLLFRNVESRLAEYLLQAVDRWGEDNREGELINASITHLDIANSIGSTRETVTLTLGVFRRQGFIRTLGRKLIVVDRGGLRELAA